MTLTEAAACGTPAVATRINGHLDAVLDGRSGLLADGSRDLADKIAAVLGDDELRLRRLGAPDFDAKVAEVRADLGLDESLPVQYGRWVKGLVTGDLGKYYRSAGTTRAKEVGKALPVSLLLVLYTQVVALLVAIPLGVLDAHKAQQAPRRTIWLWHTLAAFSMIAATVSGLPFVVVAVPLFTLVVYQVYVATDKSINVAAFLALSVPSFVFSFALKKAFAIDQSWLPGQRLGAPHAERLGAHPLRRLAGGHARGPRRSPSTCACCAAT